MDDRRQPPGRLTRPRQAPAGADQPRPRTTALDPASLAWQLDTQSGAEPRNPNHHGASRSPNPHRPRAPDNHPSTAHLTTPGPSWMTADNLLADSPDRVKRQPARISHAREPRRLTRPASPGNWTLNPGQSPGTPTITGPHGLPTLTDRAHPTTTPQPPT